MAILAAHVLSFYVLRWPAYTERVTISGYRPDGSEECIWALTVGLRQQMHRYPSGCPSSIEWLLSRIYAPMIALEELRDHHYYYGEEARTASWVP